MRLPNSSAYFFIKKVGKIFVGFKRLYYLCISKGNQKEHKTMRVRLTYRVETYVEGDTIEECKANFENAEQLDEQFVEMVSVEDADTYDDLSKQW